MRTQSTSARLAQIMRERGLRQTDVIEIAKPFCKEFGISLQKSALSQYLSGKTEPGQDKLFILGHVFDVNEAWLMGYDVPMERGSYDMEYDSDPGNNVVRLNTRLARMSAEQRQVYAGEFLKQLDDASKAEYQSSPKRALISIVDDLSDEQIDAILKLLGE